MRDADQALSVYMHELEDLRQGHLVLALRDGLNTMGSGIARSEARMEKAEQERLAREAESKELEEGDLPAGVVFDLHKEAEGPLQEVLFGSAFVLCQTSLTRITSEFKRFQRSFMNVEPKPHELLAKGDFVEGTRCSRATAIHALANYFKHKDEWEHSAWENPTVGRHEYTVPRLTEIGLPPWPKLRSGARLLGIGCGGDLVRLADDVVGLVETLQKEIWAELEPALSPETRWRCFGES